MKMLKPSDVAKELNIAYRTVLDLIHKGDLKAYRIRSHLRIPESEVKRYLESVRIKVRSL